MASPKGAYTPKSGAFAGQQFRSYFAYQQARSRSLGFSSYSAERRYTADPMSRALEARAYAVGGLSRADARRSIRQFLERQGRASGSRKHNAIAFGIDMGWWDDGDDAADDIPY